MTHYDPAGPLPDMCPEETYEPCPGYVLRNVQAVLFRGLGSVSSPVTIAITWSSNVVVCSCSGEHSYMRPCR